MSPTKLVYGFAACVFVTLLLSATLEADAVTYTGSVNLQLANTDISDGLSIVSPAGSNLTLSGLRITGDVIISAAAASSVVADPVRPTAPTTMSAFQLQIQNVTITGNLIVQNLWISGEMSSIDVTDVNVTGRTTVQGYVLNGTNTMIRASYFHSVGGLVIQNSNFTTVDVQHSTLGSLAVNDTAMKYLSVMHTNLTLPTAVNNIGYSLLPGNESLVQGMAVMLKNVSFHEMLSIRNLLVNSSSSIVLDEVNSMAANGVVSIVGVTGNASWNDTLTIRSSSFAALWFDKTALSMVSVLDTFLNSTAGSGVLYMHNCTVPRLQFTSLSIGMPNITFDRLLSRYMEFTSSTFGFPSSVMLRQVDFLSSFTGVALSTQFGISFPSSRYQQLHFQRCR